MSDQVKPALTPEEWVLASPRTGFVESLDRTEEWRIVNKCCGCALPTAHGIAAFALHGQPFGFNHKDVDYLLGLHHIDGDALAAKIAALLPPRI